MGSSEIPGHYLALKERFPDVIGALEALGGAIRGGGPIDDRHSHLIQLAAAAAAGSEGAVHSHTRRALECGAGPDEIRHALLLLITTIGFPRAAAALSWAEDVLDA